NPIEFERPDELPADVDKWLRSREFEEHPLLSRREELFQSRLSRTNEDQQLLLELVAAHCPEPNDFAFYHVVRDDFYEILRSTEKDDRQMEIRFSNAYGSLRASGLIRIEDDPRTGIIRLWIAKQWWHSVFEEFRRRGRRV